MPQDLTLEQRRGAELQEKFEKVHSALRRNNDKEMTQTRRGLVRI